MAVEDLSPRKTLAEVLEIVQALALTADGAQMEDSAIMGGALPYSICAMARFHSAQAALAAELVAAHRSGMLDLAIAIARAYRARLQRSCADGMFALPQVARRRVLDPHFTHPKQGLDDLGDLALVALESAINTALAEAV